MTPYKYNVGDLIQIKLVHRYGFYEILTREQNGSAMILARDRFLSGGGGWASGGTPWRYTVLVAMEDEDCPREWYVSEYWLESHERKEE